MRNNRNKPKPELATFVNNITGESFEAYFMGMEDIEGKPFYVLKMKQHPRVVKMATSALKKIKTPVDLNQKLV